MNKREAPERIRLLKRDGLIIREWFYPDATVDRYEDEFIYVLSPVLILTEQEIQVLTDYHYHEANKATTRRGDRVAERLHLERLAAIRASKQ